MRSRHVSVWIEASAEAVYSYAADPRHLADWAAGLAEGAVRETPQGWVADSPMGQVGVEFTEVNPFGVLDHVVRLPSGDAVYNPMRVIPSGVANCEVVFTIRQRPGMTDDEFEADAAAVTADLERLRSVVAGV
ncbi:SRPBCC family protein [Mycobacterium sp. 21AC1]|uniref:SRPBCC family protein n=1 Tax=[Mycobacterium] appelbergii TaxID=2939269 RepID=UPI0029391FC1|nr:SRPBCC family protein [Mycobacterium sp. 21AC1]MDV3124732.1 SRPBCC family protein [Mycobacterium sp. 21AC1]